MKESLLGADELVLLLGLGGTAEGLQELAVGGQDVGLREAGDGLLEVGQGSRAVAAGGPRAGAGLKQAGVAAVAARGADCTTTGGTTRTSGYDSADRLTDAGYTYDAFGRTTALPGSTVAYYASDLAQQVTTGANRTSWSLDSAQRFRTSTAETYSGGTWTAGRTTTNHYGADADYPRWVTDNLGNLTRNVLALGGDLTATTGNGNAVTLQLANLHGDVALQLPLGGAAPTVLDHEEYGTPRAGQATAAYGWLGAKQRSAETPGGLLLMGVRLYNPGTGRFLSVDPVYGGNANAYDYTSGDPLTRYDLDGRWSCPQWCSWAPRKIAETEACHSLGRGCGWAKQMSDIISSMAPGGHGKENAMRHFMWQAGLTLYFGAAAAKRLGDAHEVGQHGKDHDIDVYNNAYARRYAGSYWFRKRMKAAISRRQFFEVLYQQAERVYNSRALRE
ncbi:RHS repeat-associated core domain-containing protein [Kitasatospora sp. NPDC048365]|uniref:RHS repeat-associated core domain-containing protein n=1 Tax=Kitasatospora sp. NPDC048365 TaxID=3364050 RepID=UPI00371E48AF